MSTGNKEIIKPKKGQRHELTAIIKDKKGNILSIGRNSYEKTHPIMFRMQKRLGEHEPKKNYLHAEIDAIIRLKFQDVEKAYSIEVYRPLKRGGFGDSKPCPICRKAIEDFTSIKEIRYFWKGEFVVDFIS